MGRTYVLGHRNLPFKIFLKIEDSDLPPNLKIAFKISMLNSIKRKLGTTFNETDYF